MFLPLPQYGIVLDAGSSRTTVYVYEWPAEKENDTGVVSQTFKCNVKGKEELDCRMTRVAPKEIVSLIQIHLRCV